MQISEYRKLTKQNKSNKFGAIKTIYRGHKYDSKAEAFVARLLDQLKKAKDERVVDIKRQKLYKIKIDGTYIGSYRADFYAVFQSGKHRIGKVIEVKSPYTEKQTAWRFKKKVIEASCSILIEVWIVAYKKGEPYILEVKN